jgi:hypothetical protein
MIKLSRNAFLFAWICAVLAFSPLGALAEPNSSTTPPNPSRAPSGKKQIDFEDSVIENVQRKNVDYLTLPGSRGADGKIRHLYKKRTDFDDKNQSTLFELGVSP